ncbi:MAG: outer membrane protein transport protein [Candidatus Omnitrophota bacterium]
MKFRISVLIGISLLFTAPARLFAVGSGAFENATFSARSLAQGDAVTAQADEPAAISYNPAGIVNLPGIQMQSNGAVISSFTFQSGPDGSQSKSTGSINFIPTGYVTINPGCLLGDRVAFGFGSDSPFGLSNKYKSASPIAHYTTYDAWLKMYTLKPVAAVKVTDWLSLGGGPIYYRIFDFGGVMAYPNQALGFPFPDGQARLNLSGNTWGWHMGALVKPHRQHQFGFYFRSPVTVRARGLVKVENATVGGNFETGGNVKINLPLDFTFGYAFKPTERTTIETDFVYTRWSTHRRLFINADPVNMFDDAILSAIGKADKDYNDSFLIGLGANHKLNKKWTLLGGMDFRWAAVPEAHFTPSVPDSNRLSVSVGVQYAFTDYLDIALTHYSSFSLTRKIDNDISETLGTSVDGRYFSYLQDIVFSATLKWDDVFQRRPTPTRSGCLECQAASVKTTMPVAVE